MPQTSSRPAKGTVPVSTPRLFVDQPLASDCSLHVDGQQAHYLLKVMRCKTGDMVKLFDDKTGEYLAIVATLGKRDLTLKIEARLREREDAPDLWLCQAAIKKDRFDWIAEKSCELGIRRFQPVLTSRCVVNKIKEDRLRSHMIEAAEQCERSALPEISSLIKLEKMLNDWPSDRNLFFCDERGGDDFTAAISTNPGPAAILIGPEGGFSDAENAAIRACPAAAPVSLGPRILRADTAAVSAISIWMAQSEASDWR